MCLGYEVGEGSWVNTDLMVMLCILINAKYIFALYQTQNKSLKIKVENKSNKIKINSRENKNMTLFITY